MMSENRRTLITIGAILGLCGFIGCMSLFVLFGLGKEVDKRINIAPGGRSQAAENIAQFEMPEGYNLTSGMSLFVFDMATLTSSTNKALPSIMLVQFGEYSSIDLDTTSVQIGNEFPVVDTFQITIRGKETTVTVSENSRTRQWTAIFDGLAGDAIFLAEGPISGWDEQLLLDFIKSMK